MSEALDCMQNRSHMAKPKKQPDDVVIIYEGQDKLREINRELDLSCTMERIELILRERRPRGVPTWKDLNEFLVLVGKGTLPKDEIKQQLQQSIAWWHEGVAAVAASYAKQATVPHADLNDAIAAFTNYSNSFDERGQNAVKVLFTVAGAAAAVVAFAIPSLIKPDDLHVGCWILMFAGMVLIGNLIWARIATNILDAYYSLYVAGIVDAARKHAAFGVGKHMWLEYVYRELKKCPRDQSELIQCHCAG